MCAAALALALFGTFPQYAQSALLFQTYTTTNDLSVTAAAGEPSPSGTVIEQLLISTGINARNWVGADSVHSLTPDGLYCWSMVRATVPVQIIHEWIWEGRRVDEIPLQVEAGSFRTWSRKTNLRPGEWTVVARDATGHELSRIDFKIRWEDVNAGCRLEVESPDRAISISGEPWVNGFLYLPEDIWMADRRLNALPGPDISSAVADVSLARLPRESYYPLPVQVRISSGPQHGRGDLRAEASIWRVSQLEERTLNAAGDVAAWGPDFALTVSSWARSDAGLRVSYEIRYKLDQSLGPRPLRMFMRLPSGRVLRPKASGFSFDDASFAEILKGHEHSDIAMAGYFLFTEPSDGQVQAELVRIKRERLDFLIRDYPQRAKPLP